MVAERNLKCRDSNNCWICIICRKHYGNECRASECCTKNSI